jgi:hypothetical protein
MTKYNVHIYREMRLTFAGIEAETSEIAAAIARETPTGDADDIEDCEGETLTALVDLAGADDFAQSVTIEFEGQRMRKAAPDLLEALKSAERLILDLGKVIRGLDNNEEWSGFWTTDDDYLCCDSRYDAIVAAIAKATTACPPRRAEQCYSVLLLYPDYANDSGTDTYYTFVTAADSIEAVTVAQRKAAAAQEGWGGEPEDFSPLLVTQGQHYSEPLFNK